MLKYDNVTNNHHHPTSTHVAYSYFTHFILFTPYRTKDFHLKCKREGNWNGNAGDALHIIYDDYSKHRLEYHMKTCLSSSNLHPSTYSQSLHTHTKRISPLFIP